MSFQFIIYKYNYPTAEQSEKYWKENIRSYLFDEPLSEVLGYIRIDGSKEDVPDIVKGFWLNTEPRTLPYASAVAQCSEQNGFDYRLELHYFTQNYVIFNVRCDPAVHSLIALDL